jgi:hypothetical protein
VPLKAIVEGETIIGPDLSQEEWTTLKSRNKNELTITMGCCGVPGHLRISTKGTRHFYKTRLISDAITNRSQESTWK